MAKGKGERQRPRESGSQPKNEGNLALPALAGVVALLVMAFGHWWNVKYSDRTPPDLLASRADRARAPAAKRPDPNRVYTIQTAGAPARGPVGAPVTIAEFSDFE